MSDMTKSEIAAASVTDDGQVFSSKEFGLDKRILKAISTLGYHHPTLVQAQTIPLALAGKDLLIQARTGSGKTLAFVLPTIQKLLSQESNKGVSAVIIVPTKELCIQTITSIKSVIKYCNDQIHCVGLLDRDSSRTKGLINMYTDIVVGTPKLLADYVDENGGSVFAHMNTLIIDEADLIMSYGYSGDMNRLLTQVPSTCQNLIVSATLNDSVNALKQKLLHNCVVIKLAEVNSNLNEYFIEVKKDDKMLVLYSLLRLDVIQGKVIIFVDSLDTCYALHILLTRFSMKSVVLNNELPAISRNNIIFQFNSGQYQYLIATDEGITSIDGNSPAKTNSTNQPHEQTSVKEKTDAEMGGSEGGDGGIVEWSESESVKSGVMGDDDDDDDDDEDEDEEDEEMGDEDMSIQDKGKEQNDEDKMFDVSDSDNDDDDDDDDDDSVNDSINQSFQSKFTRTTTDVPDDVDDDPHPSKAVSKPNEEEHEEFSVSRGVDFTNVNAVLNYNCPHSLTSYIHRIGRTARAFKKGTALTLIDPQSLTDSSILLEIQKHNPPRDGQPVPVKLPFRVNDIESFRYRVDDIRRGITQRIIRSVRILELKRELSNSKKLKAHFNENPGDLRALQHVSRSQHLKPIPHLKDVPDYLIPDVLKPKLPVQSVDTSSTPNNSRGHIPNRYFDPLQSFAVTTELLNSNTATNTLKSKKNDKRISKIVFPNKGKKRGHPPHKKHGPKGKRRKS